MTQKPRLWLHVGPAKTGTTTIQEAFEQNTDLLQAAGLLFPVLGEDPAKSAMVSHHEFAQALHQDRFDLIQSCVDAIPPAPETVISSEWITKVGRDRVPRLTRLAEILSGRYDVRVIYYARDPVDRCSSLIQQAVKGGKCSLEHVLTTPRKYNLRRDLKELARAFRKPALIVLPFGRSAFVRGDLLSDFCSVIGHEGLLDNVKRTFKNESMSMETVLAIDAYRQKTGDMKRISATDPRFQVSNGSKFTLPDDVIRKISADAAPELDWLAETYGVDLRKRPAV